MLRLPRKRVEREIATGGRRRPLTGTLYFSKVDEVVDIAGSV